MKNHHYVLILLLPILLSFGYQDSVSKSKRPIKDVRSDTIGLTEAEAYRMLYENQVKANDSILKTIVYALGGLGSAILLVFASNWWFNEKRVRDIIIEIDTKVKSVKKDTLAELTEKIGVITTDQLAELNKFQAKLQEEITSNIAISVSKFNEFTEKIRAEIKEDNKTLSEGYGKQLDSFNENYRQQLTSINENFNSQYATLRELTNTKEEALRQLISSEQNKRIEDINDVNQKMSRIEFYMWKDSGVFRNAFAALIDELEYRLRKKTTPIANFRLILDQMSETLDKCNYILVSDKKIALTLINSLEAHEKINDKKLEVIAKLDKIEVREPSIK